MQLMRELEADRVMGGGVIADDAYLGDERGGSENKVLSIAAVEVADCPVRMYFDRLEGFCSVAVSK